MKRFLVCSLATSSLFVAVLGAQTVVSQPPPPKISVGTGFDYSRGFYGFTTATEYTSVPLNLNYDDGPWTVRVSIPYVTLKGPATIVGGGGTARPTAQSESGLGDVSAGGTYRFGAVLGDLNASFTERVKFPTASDSRGLGTGRTDFYSQFDFSQTFGSVTPFGTIGYRVLGRSAAYALKDGLYLSAGSHFRLSADSIVTVALDWGQRILAGGDPTSDAMVVLTHDLNSRWQAVVYVLKGFNDASPDWGAGGSINYRF